MDSLMKKIVCVISVTVIIMGMIAGCGGGGISKGALGVECDGKKYCLGDTLPEDVMLRSDDDSMIVGQINVKSQKIWQIGVSSRSPANVKTLCGVQLGDSLEKVTSVLGQNLQYDEIKNDPSFDAKTGFFHIVYCYYADNGKLYGISDRINSGHYAKDKMDKEEKAYYDTVKDRLQTEAYRVGFGIRDGKVATVEFLAGDIRYIGKYMGVD